MTRETKIGLLVGLAFIIVIGILLSDHLSSTTEPPPATLAQAGASVRQGVSVPGISTGVAPVTHIAPAQPPVTGPQQPVPTQEELATPKPKPVVQIAIGPASTGEQGTGTPPVTFVQNNNEISASPETTTPPTESTTGTGSEPTSADPLEEIARRAGEPIIGLDGNAPKTGSNASGNTDSQQLLNGFREYKAAEGDTVSRMAVKFLGENTQGNRDLIIKANPSLQKNPDIVVSGRTYRIPITQPARTAVATAPKPATAADPSGTSEYMYTVKPGDSLWRIANTELGNAGAVSALKELNSDILKGGDTVQVGMKLKLPSKPVASAQ